MHFLELGLILGCYFVYFFTRGAVFSDLDSKGFENAEQVASAEMSLGIFWEAGWQSWALANAEGLVAFLNWAYIVTYWPIILTLGFVLYVTARPRYYYYRTVVLVNFSFALLIFLLFPVSPPFDLTGYFIDTIQEFGPTYYGSPAMAAFYNTTAAMPSLHVSWTIILGVVFVRTFRGWYKALGVVYPILTLAAITITGNHFLLDAVAGAFLAVVAFGVVWLWDRRTRWTPGPQPNGTTK